MPKTFAMIGASGYIAPRHMKAIKEVEGELVCALDPFDSVGIIDSYFPGADFFTEPERFDRHLDKLKRKGTPVDYVVVCSPNYLHDAHIRLGLRNARNVICEKPLVLKSRNIDGLKEIEKETGGKIYTILQLRLHPAVQALKNRIETNNEKYGQVKLSYITSRGNWYYYSWKGDIQKSGGVITNIGVHFFDMLSWVFGAHEQNVIHINYPNKAYGHTYFDRATVEWFLSLDENDLPKDCVKQGKRTYRKLTINGEEFEFSDGFTDLHTESYRQILAGNGFGIDDARASIEIVEKLRLKNFVMTM